ncbi:MAG: MAPEG family protein [Pseudolabrys sp.]|nr:MAPEG family protein [Pseudolabrys sp.]
MFAVQPSGMIVWPMLAQFALTLALYGWLTVARKRAVERGETDYTAFVLGYDEPLHVARITRNLANQFELPVLFYALVLLLVTAGDVTTFDVIAAWVFVVGRVLHTMVQTFTDNVPLRGRVFAINYLAVIAMAGHLAWRLI